MSLKKNTTLLEKTGFLISSYTGLRSSVKGFQQGALLKQIPIKNDALFWLDGVIIEDGGNKYFRDKTANGRNFLITDYDFDSTWIGGMPYKSAATISAPVGDSALIAADINNYLYDSGGDPNQIPVVSLFQDIDYEHKLFCRHFDQALDSNGVETRESRINHIVLYNTVKSSTDLTICQNWYNVPDENVSAYWVSTDGNDTSGDGSKENPWATISKANSTAPSGSEIYCKTGNYTRSTSYLALGNINITALGFCELKNVDVANYYIRVEGVGITAVLNNFILNANSVSNYHIYNFSGSFSLVRCLLKGELQYYSYTASLSGESLLYNSCVLPYVDSTATGAITAGHENISIKNSYISVVCGSVLTLPGSSSVDFLYNKVTGTLTNAVIHKTSSSANNVNITGGTFNLQDGGIISVNNAGRIGDTTIKHAIINSDSTTKNLLSNRSAAGTDTIENCDINFITTNGYLIYTTERNLILKNNTITHNAVFVSVSSTSEINCNIENNILLPTSTASLGFIGYGSDTAYINAVCKNNAVYADNYTHGQHGFQFYDCKMVDAKYNYIENISLALIGKSNGTITHENNIFSYNVIKNGRFAFRSITGSKVYNNTVVNTEDIGFSAMNTNLVHGCVDIDYKNNIYKCSGTISAISSDASEDSWISDYNIWNCTNAVNDGGSVYTLSQAQTGGYGEANSVDSDPLLINNIPQTGSPAIGLATDMGVNFDIGLGSTTDFGGGTNLPNIVTKQQGLNWDIGAYVV